MAEQNFSKILLSKIETKRLKEILENASVDRIFCNNLIDALERKQIFSKKYCDSLFLGMIVGEFANKFVTKDNLKCFNSIINMLSDVKRLPIVKGQCDENRV